MEPIDYRDALTRGWRLMLVFGIIGLAIGLLLPSSIPGNQWSSTSEVGALPAETTGSSPLSPGVGTDQILFYAGSDSVIQQTGQIAEFGEPLDSIRALIKVQGPSNNGGTDSGQPGVVQVTVHGPTAVYAQRVDNAFDKALGTGLFNQASAQLQGQKDQVGKSITAIEYELNHLNASATGTEVGVLTVNALQNELGALVTKQADLSIEAPYTGYTVLQSASVATKNATSLTATRPVRGFFGLLVGVVLGALIALAVSLLDKRLRSASRAETAFGYPVVAVLPAESIPAAEEYRMLWLAVFQEPLAQALAGEEWDSSELALDRLDAVPVGASVVASGVEAGHRSWAEPAPQRSIVMVASPSNEPTRAFVAVNLARTCAESGQRVVVISTDSGAGSIEDDYNALRPKTPLRASDVERALERSSLPGVSVLRMQSLVSHPGQFTSLAPELIGVLRDMFDVVIFEVPPFLSVHHGEALAPLVDVVLVVAEREVTLSNQVRRTGTILKRLEAPVAGLAFTNVPLAPEDVRNQTSEPFPGPDSTGEGDDTIDQQASASELASVSQPSADGGPDPVPGDVDTGSSFQDPPSGA